MEHGRLHIKLFVKQHALPKLRLKEGMQIDRLTQNARFVPCARRLAISCAIAPRVFSRLIERPVHPQEIQHALAIFPRNLGIQRALMHALHQQLTHMPTRIVDYLTHHGRFAAHRGIVLHVG